MGNWAYKNLAQLFLRNCLCDCDGLSLTQSVRFQGPKIKRFARKRTFQCREKNHTMYCTVRKTSKNRKRTIIWQRTPKFWPDQYFVAPPIFSPLVMIDNALELQHQGEFVLGI